jgi:hypothetical protein
MAENIVEIGFDVSGSPLAPFVTLNDPVKGLLASEAAPSPFVLGGTLFFDVTDKVLNYGISRGKTRQLDRYSSGQVTINLDNTDRTFDPLYSGSEYAGQIIPRRPVRVTSNGTRQVVASIDDWDLAYEAQGRSIATAKASDGLTQLANQVLTGGVQVEELSGARIDKVLSDSEVKWPLAQRNLDAGRTTLQADTIPAGRNALEYIQKITTSEPGSFFISKNGRARFRDRFSQAAAAGATTFADDSSGINYTNLRVVYGTEILNNEIILERQGGGTVTAVDLVSQEQYGIFNLTLTDLLMSDDTNAQNLANFLRSKLANPEYRFEELTVNIEDITVIQDGFTLDDPIKGRLDTGLGLAASASELPQNKVLALELGDVVQVTFTPSGIGDAIERAVEIIRISQRVTPTNHEITFGLGGLEVNFWRLDDPFFGKLSAGNSLAY